MKPGKPEQTSCPGFLFSWRKFSLVASEGGVDIDHVNQLVVDELGKTEIKQLAPIAGATDASKWQIGFNLGWMRSQTPCQLKSELPLLHHAFRSW